MDGLLMILAAQTLGLLAYARFHRVTVLRMLVLRQQLAVDKRSAKKPRLKNRDRLFWFVISGYQDRSRGGISKRSFARASPAY